MKSLINECLVLSWVIEKYKLQNKQNPCSLCEYATEHCKQYLQNGFVPLTGEEIIKLQEPKKEEMEVQIEAPIETVIETETKNEEVQELEQETEIVQEKNQETPPDTSKQTTSTKRALKSTPKKKRH